MSFRIEKIASTFAAIYFIIGIVLAFFYALFYHWEALSFLSPGFYAVVLTWPVQIPGWMADFRVYGFTGKTII